MLSYQEIQAFVYAEARALDEARWVDWLAFYADDAEFFMPSWDDDDQVTSDPQNEVSLIYYPNKQGLEDRVFRIQTERSSATIPDTRTGHAVNNLEVLSQTEDEGLYIGQHEYWLDTMKKAVVAEQAERDEHRAPAEQPEGAQ